MLACEKAAACPPERRGWLADVADICNSELAQGIATALVILAVLLGIGGCWHLKKTGDAQLEKAKAKAKE